MIEFWLLDCIIISYDVRKSVSINKRRRIQFRFIQKRTWKILDEEKEISSFREILFSFFSTKKKNYVWINGSAHFDRFLVKRTTGSQGCNFVEILCSVLRQSRVTKLEYKLEFD